MWYRVAYWDYWYLIRDIDQYGNVWCTVWRPDGSTYETAVWAYKFDQGWLVFNKVTINKEELLWRDPRSARPTIHGLTDRRDVTRERH